ncbi:MAG: Type 1 glutamine amidotransferase-like domain-containing protein [Actinomycetota bacterium]|nr:Type 1 glutamine amidotransferase-like domain-containing protein [Actinomycetota bacterium]
MADGTLALIGGGEFTDGCSFDETLLARSGAAEVAVIPTAAAFERPAKLLEAAEGWFSGLGARVAPIMALRRRDAFDATFVSTARRARFLYLVGASPMHMIPVLKRTPLWEAIVDAYREGAVLAAAGPSAVALCDAMVDPRGGGFGLGLGLVDRLALVPRYDRWSEDKVRRTIRLAPQGLALCGIDERTALISDPDGRWRVEGAGNVDVFVDGERTGIESLAALV